MTSRKHPHDPREREGEEPATESLEARIAELESATVESRDRYLRLAADFDNYKKRTRQEQLETIQHASAGSGAIRERRPSGACANDRSRPAENARPSPRTTTTRTSPVNVLP